jgi:hypothetical protein
METKLVRENRKMRILTVAAVALLVVLAGSGIADASVVPVVTLSVEGLTTQLSLDNSNGPLYTTYTVYATVTGNTTDDTFGFTLYGGVASWMIDQMYSPSGIIGHYPVQPPPPGNATSVAANITVMSPFTAVVAKGNIVEVWSPSPPTPPQTYIRTGTSGVDNTTGAEALPASKFAYYDPPYATPYQLGNLDASGGVKVALFSGRIDAKANGGVDLTFAGQANTVLVWKLNADGLYSSIATSVVPAMAHINVGPPPVTNTAPVMDSVSPNPVLETTWTHEPGWNNPAHTVVMTATAHDADNNPLTFIWMMTNPNPGGTSHQLTGDAAVFNLTIAELLAKFPGELPAGKGIPGYLYDWDLAVQAYDGTVVSSNTIHVPVFVPEPATIGLLSFGIVGALLRRRRRA